jgi:hypothetical protein
MTKKRKTIKNRENKLTIIYDGKPDDEFEEAIEKFVKKFGWKWEGSGYDFVDDKRDLSFYKKL